MAPITPEELGGQVFEPAHWPALGFYGNVFIRRIELDYRGQTLPGHKHNYDHATFVGKGRVRVKWTSPTDGSVRFRELEGPDWFEVPAHADHEIVALSNGCVCFCVFAVRDESGEVAEFITEQHLAKPAFQAIPRER